MPKKKISGAQARRKGREFENEIVKAFQAIGVEARRVPLSGAAGGYYEGDVIIPIEDGDLRAECKRRANGFRQIYGWLDGNDLLFLRSDQQQPGLPAPVPLVVVPLDTFLELTTT